ncbi:MAG: dTDP-4-dehydrorhamnose reductase [Gemmatimonadales bacterium]|nr:dTDP-4-dehydrorhamnose reductase [Gemmatimonadales bacterium]MDZ4390384.1 dTDP-4-dehydrorhamnose reductase [Gemmatimonadales bacterium]
MAPERPDRRLLLLGRTGQVGHELETALAPLGQVIALDRTDADLSDPESLRAVVRTHRPHAIVNAAAYTSVDRAESESDLAMSINGVAPGVLAEEARDVDACLVHYSTDYVFDGRKEGPYHEQDTPNPLSSYGDSKLAGERAVVAAGGRHLILRTCWVVGAHGINFLKTILRLAAERDTLRVVADQQGTPTTAALIAEATATTLKSMLTAPVQDRRWGLYHVAASGATTWHGYARYLIARAHEIGMPLRATPEGVTAITTADYPTPAARPGNSRLETTRLRATFPVQLPDWRQGVDQVLEQLMAGHRP